MGHITRMIEKDEAFYESALLEIAETIRGDRNIKLVVIAGPSCSGKTTTTEKTLRLLRAKEMGAYMISIDDFYKSLRDVPLGYDGERDFESLESIDLESLHNCLHDLTEGKRVDIPLFDFGEKRKTGTRYTIQLGEGEVAVLEGLHALNPLIYEKYVADEHIYKIYLNSYPKNNRNSQTRLLRRLVRDYHFRFSDAEKTFSMWDSVRAGEKKYISPFESRADIGINTFFPYEASVLKPDAIKILAGLPAQSRYADKADGLLRHLSGYDEIDKRHVPCDSLLREFIG